MTGAWGRILAQYGQSVTLRRGEEERGCRAFLQPVRERREDWYQELPTPLGTVRRDQWLYLGPPELSLEETNGLCVEWNGLRFAVRAAQPVCVNSLMDSKAFGSVMRRETLGLSPYARKGKVVHSFQEVVRSTCLR